MSAVNLWDRLKAAQLISGEQPNAGATKDQAFWYIRALQGFAGWLAAVFLIGFLGFGVIGLFEHGAALMLLGLVLNVSTYVYFKSEPDSDFFEQMVLAFSLTGQFLFAFGLFELFNFKDQQWLVLVAVYQLILMVVMQNYLHRFLSAWFAVIAFFWGFDVLVFTGVGAAMVAALFVWMWLNKAGWETEKDFYEPIGYALGLSLLQLNIQSHFWLFDWFRHRQQEMSWLMFNADWISALLNSTVLLYFVYRMVQEHNTSLSSVAGRMITLAAVVLLFSAMPVIGLSSALLVLLVGFARVNKTLMVMGGLALLGFVGWYYYSLNITLLNKSLILMAMGVVLLLGYMMVKYVQPKDASAQPDVDHMAASDTLSNWQKWAVVVTLLLGLVGVNHAIWQKETVLSEGQSVFMELAPVDPRSLMQGDYMRLRFAVASQIRANASSDQVNQDGHFYVALDERGVGQFHSMATHDQANNQANDQLVKMQYRLRQNRVQFATNAFFFQEGDAKLFDAARYGEFKVADDGELLLKAMYDKDLRLLGENRLD